MLKPILFNSPMVRAVRFDAKKATRRMVKFQEECNDPHLCGVVEARAPFAPGDILYVRESFYKDAGRYLYRADYMPGEKFCRNGREIDIKWSPSLHMPKEAARLFLRIQAVHYERLQDITDEQIMSEGIQRWTKDGSLYKYWPADAEGDWPDCKWTDCPRSPREAMAKLWDSTIASDKIATLGWDANPWVWVIEFERIPKEEAKEEIK